MIKFNSAVSFDDFSHDQQNSAYGSDYVENHLLPAVKEGNWDKLNEMPIVFGATGAPEVLFGQDVWEFKSSGRDYCSKANIIFTDNGEVLEYNLKNQLKCMMVIELFVNQTMKGLDVISGINSNFKLIVRQMIKKGLNDFEQLTFERLSEWVSEGYKIKKVANLTGLNNMLKFIDYLPFKVPFTVNLTHSKLNILPDESEQHQVIPPRIYMGILSSISESIKRALPLKLDIERAISIVLANKNATCNRLIKNIRTSGETKYFKKDNGFFKALEDENIQLKDDEGSSRWLELFAKTQPTLDFSNVDNARTLFKQKKVMVGDRVFKSIKEFGEYIRQLDSYCKFACLILSGMRGDELSRMTTVYGAQKVMLEGQEIYLLTTKQSKITGNTQTKDDVFVTTKVGYEAFQLIKAIAEPKHKYISKNSFRINLSTAFTLSTKEISKNNFSECITKFINNGELVDMTLNSEDIKYIAHSDPAQSKYKVNDTYEITMHQTRRSFAFYLVGYELLSYPQLKEQLSHYSMAMTRWYARNGSSFKKMYSQITEERNIQQSEIWVRVMNKIANKERIAGGKGKAMLSELAKQGQSYFQEGDDKRNKLSKRYWLNELKNNRHKIHAIAPGMYCTSQGCKMRINIDLTECVDCEFDFIEDAVYAESSRMNAMRSISYAHEIGELNESLASKYVMQIKAAEKIMNDIDFKYEPYQIPEKISSLLIATKRVVK